MNKFIRTIIPTAFYAVITYFLFAFGAWSLVLTEWHWCLRILFAGINVFLLLNFYGKTKIKGMSDDEIAELIKSYNDGNSKK